MRWFMFSMRKGHEGGLPSGEQTYDGVPLHRTYGQRRKKRPVREFAVTVFAGSALFYVLSVFALALLAIVAAILTFIEILVATVFVFIAGSLLLLALTKTVRKRRKTERKIKKLCKKNKLVFEKKVRGMKAFRWNYKKPSFILKTEGCEYYVHYFTVGHYNSSMLFQGKREIQLIKYPINNPFTVIVGAKTKIITVKSEFEALGEGDGGRKRKRVILVNPVCREMYAKSKDGGVVATGNGFSEFGYTVYTGSGFCEAVIRNCEDYEK